MAAGLRVLQAMAGANPGGAEMFFVRLVRALRDAGIDQHIVVKRNAYAAKRLREYGLEPEEFAFGGWLDLTTRGNFRRAIERFEPQIVLTWMNRATRYTPRDVSPSSVVHVGRLGGYYNLKYYRQCDHLIANTRDIADYLVGHGRSADAVHYLPNFADATVMPAAARHALNTPPDAPLLLALGRLHANKAFDVLLAALVDVPDAFLWLGGTGKLDDELRGQAARLGVDERVRFLGWRDDAAALYAAADLYVCPSRIEPLGNVVIEAWAHNTPVVAAAAAGPVSLIADGTSGLLVPIDDAAALASAINRALASPNLATALAEEGRRRYEQEFTEAAVVEQYVKFFETVAR